MNRPYALIALLAVAAAVAGWFWMSEAIHDHHGAPTQKQDAPR